MHTEERILVGMCLGFAVAAAALGWAGYKLGVGHVDEICRICGAMPRSTDLQAVFAPVRRERTLLWLWQVFASALMLVCAFKIGRRIGVLAVVGSILACSTGWWLQIPGVLVLAGLALACVVQLLVLQFRATRATEPGLRAVWLAFFCYGAAAVVVIALLDMRAAGWEFAVAISR